MAISEMEMSDVLKRAAALMSPEGEQQIEYARKMNRNSFDEEGGYSQPSGSNNMSKNARVTTTPTPNRHSKLPKAIQESIMSNPLNDTANEYSMQGSVLDNINCSAQKENSPMQETYQYNYSNEPSQIYQQKPQQVQYMPQMQIDYNYIRSIVNECIQANIKQIKEEILKESTLKAIRVGGENKIQLIDNKNNLYESKLEFKKNLNKK
jgi:hypothetical protein